MISSNLFVTFLLGIGLFISETIYAQAKYAVSTVNEDSVLQRIAENPSIDSRTKSFLLDSIFRVASAAKDTCNQTHALILQSTSLDNLGMTDSALFQLYKASSLYKGQCDSNILMTMYANLTSVYLSLNELDRLDSISQLALNLWNPGWKKQDLRFAILNNMAISYINRGNPVKATELFHQVYQEAKSTGNQNYIQQGLMNLGGIKGYSGDLDSAYYFLNEAAILAQESKDIDDLLVLLINLANLDRETGRFRQAHSKLDSAFALAESWNRIGSKANVERARADVYAKTNNFKQAYDHLGKFITLHEDFLNEERVKAVTEMMEKYESEKKARQIQQLEYDKLEVVLKNERVTNARNRYLFTGLCILLLAIGLWGRLHFVRKSRTAIQKEKDLSESLLLNILPATVAEELKSTGKAEATEFPSTTILFTDFKEFTNLAGQLTAQELVGEINVCFKAFDEITTRHGLEKIKTIGDAYMAASGIPQKNTASAIDAVHAALEMQEFIDARKQQMNTLHLPAFEMRAGLHSGPVVAGIVGVKKFQYDIWGDTVNIASRMETNSEIGQVNISETTYRLVKDYPDFHFFPRGMIQVKGKGALAMYFVKKIT